MREETGIEVQAKDLKFLGMADVSDVDVRYESPAFAMHLSSRPKIRLSRELIDSEWFPISSLPKEVKNHVTSSVDLWQKNRGQ